MAALRRLLPHLPADCYLERIAPKQAWSPQPKLPRILGAESQPQGGSRLVSCSAESKELLAHI